MEKITLAKAGWFSRICFTFTQSKLITFKQK